MDPRNVFLDTEALRHDPMRRSAPFGALTHLAERGIVRIHVSQLSVSEFSSGVKDHASSLLGKLAQGLRTLAGLSDREDFRGRGHSLLQDLASLSADTCADCIAAFRRWLNSTEVVVHPIGAQHTERVFEAYFSGSAPFSQKKNRADIPDAFIWQAIAELAASAPVLFVVKTRISEELRAPILPSHPSLPLRSS